MRRTIAAMLSILALAGTTPAAGQARGTNCDITAYVIDQDAAGLNVRAGPSANAPVLRVISNQGSGVARIREQRGAWFRVSAIVDAENDQDLFRADGWIHASLVTLSVANADPRLYARPQPGSRAIARLVAEDSLVTLIGCAGHWAKVRAAGREGWLSPNGQCSNPLTTCA